MRRWPARLVVLVLGLAGCGSSGAAKLGAPRGPVVLRLGVVAEGHGINPGVRQFAAALRRRSGGRVVVRLVPAPGGRANDVERRVVRDVAAGALDLGSTRTGVFDTLGVTSLRALTAPMLITSRGLEAKVVGGPLAPAMLAGVGRAGVVGVVVLADELRRPFGAQPLRGPLEYRGRRLAVYLSRTEGSALMTLGATVTNRWSKLPDGELDGFERTLRVFTQDVLVGVAPYITANVALWPQTVALIANPERLAGLSADERRWVTQAAADARAWSITNRAEEGELSAACASGARVVSASADDIEGLRAAFAPVYAELERDAFTRSMVARIRALAASIPPDTPPAVPADCTGAPPVGAVDEPVPTAIDGTYRWTITRADKRRDPYYDPSMPIGGDDVFTITLARGRWDATIVMGDGNPTEHNHGPYTVDGDRFTQTLETAGRETNVFRFTRTRTGLRMHTVRAEVGDAFVNTAKPWRRIGS